ncbi:hypothetical protein DQT32_03885 [Salmonella enterica subsp. enterica serovar Braenderup]|nr:hypothetical protein [Salmonella enterica subsp. enterica serovar Braenderup]
MKSYFVRYTVELVDVPEEYRFKFNSIEIFNLNQFVTDSAIIFTGSSNFTSIEEVQAEVSALFGNKIDPSKIVIKRLNAL